MNGTHLAEVCPGWYFLNRSRYNERQVDFVPVIILKQRRHMKSEKLYLTLWRAIKIIFQGLIFVGIFVPFIVGLFIEINIRTTPDIPWFIFPALFTIFFLSKKSPGWFISNRPEESKRSTTVVLTTLAIIFGLFLAIFSLLLEYASHNDLLVAGKLLLPGDTYAAPKYIQAIISLFVLGAAGPIEEIGVRLAIQFRLQDIVMRKWMAEAVADVLFVLMHFRRFNDIMEILTVSGTALICGRMASYTQRVRYPILIHTISNLGNAIIVIILRN